MRYSLVLPAFASLALALPAPQDIDLDMVAAVPDPTFTIAPGLTAQIISYDPTVVLAEATAAVSSISVEISNVASPTGAAKLKRAACDVQPTGVAAYALQSDSADAFRANGSWASMASAAPAPSGFIRTQLNAAGANNAYGYLGYHNLDSYDADKCGKICTNILGCMSFNIYFERDPSVDPGTGCTNPPSVVYAKCALWGSPLSSDSATNTGQPRAGFEVAVAGSNAYQNNTLTIPPGYTLIDTLQSAAINAPYDDQGYNTYMGSTIFTKGAFSIQACADYCTAQTAYNVKHPASDGTPPKICSFFNTYMLYKNDASSPQGQYCALNVPCLTAFFIYTESWEKSYATNNGQYRGSDYYFVRYSYTFGNSTTGAPAHGTGDQKGAIYQARQDMTYFPSSLTSTFLPYCSSLLGYTTQVITAAVTSTATALTTTTTTTTLLANRRRAAASASTPAVLIKYPGTVVSAACKLLATPVSSTSTITAYTTTTAATSTIVVQTTVLPGNRACGGDPLGGGSCGCRYTEHCATLFVDPNNPSVVRQVDTLQACAALCDDNRNCNGYSYQLSTGSCTQWKGYYTWTLQANSDYVSGSLDQNQRCDTCTESYKRDLGLADVLGMTKRDGTSMVVSPKGAQYNAGDGTLLS